jgi:hypothetical protein
METIFTLEDLLNYYYNESSSKEKEAILKALKSDIKLKSEYEKLSSTLAKLSELSLEPSESSIEIILKSAAKDQHPELQ